MHGTRKTLVTATRIYWMVIVVVLWGSNKLKRGSSCTGVFQSGWEGKIYGNGKSAKISKVTSGITYGTTIVSVSYCY